VLNLDDTRSAVSGDRRPTVVVVDREALYRWFASQALQAGYQVVDFSTVRDAATYLERGGVADALLVDEQTATDEGPGAPRVVAGLACLIPSVVFGGWLDGLDGTAVR
jgi:hypothetical protein